MTGAGSSTSGKASTNDAPCPSLRLEPHPPAVRLGEPARDREPEAGAGLVGATGDAMERREDPLPLGFRDAGAAVGDADQYFLPCGRDADGDGLAGRREPKRVLEHVGERSLDLGCIDTHRGQVVRRGHEHAILSSELVERLRDELFGSPELGSRSGRAGLKAREIEEVLDEALQPHVLDANRLEQRLAILVGQLEVVALEPVERLLDRRERGPQVVRHRLDHRCLDGIATPERLRFVRVAREPLPLERDAEQRGERRQQPALGPEHRLLLLGREEHTDRAPLDSEGMRRLVRRRARVLAQRDPHLRDAEHCRRALLDELESRRRARAPRRRSAAMSARSAASRSRCSASSPRLR